MKAVSVALAAALLGARPAASSANPLGKVIELMDSLTAKITAEGEAEEKAYVEFTSWCDDAARNKKFEIKTSTAQKGKLEAAIAKHASDISGSVAKIEELGASLAKDTADLKDATVIREAEASEFSTNEAELEESIDTLGRAIAVIEREMSKNPAAFAQMDVSTVDSLVKAMSSLVEAAAFSSADKQKLMALVQAKQGSSSDDADDLFGAPAATVYKSHSSNILDVLEDLKEKAEEELSSLRKAETNAKHNFEMLKQSLDDQLKNDNQDMADEKSSKSASAEAKATAEADLAAASASLADSQAALETTQTDCMHAASDHAATVAGRNEELKTIAEAKRILSDTTSGASDQAYSFLALQQGSGLSTRADLANIEVVNAVKKLAKEYHSSSLSQLASRISAVVRFGQASGDDPFVKVKSLITDLIAKLEAEADASAQEKAYCDDQIAKSEEKKSELETDVAKATAKIDQASATSANLKDDVKQLQAELATLAKEQSQMDEVRRETHADYLKAKADLEQGLEGVRKALSVLREYYGSAAAMLQQGDDQPAPPAQHSKAQGAGSSIVGILEVVESDFAKGLADEEMEESDAQAEYEKTTQQNEVTKTLKSKDVSYKTKEFVGLDKAVSEHNSDRATMQTELDAVMEYYSRIKDRCIAKPETYEDRKARREAEIAGLKDALSILEQETASFVQRGKRGLQQRFLGVAA